MEDREGIVEGREGGAPTKVTGRRQKHTPKIKMKRKQFREIRVVGKK